MSILDEVEQIYTQLQQCHDGISTILQMEQNLYEDNVITLQDKTQQESPTENKSVIQLEATMLDMASTPDLCQGVLYIFPIKVLDKYIVRYKYFCLHTSITVFIFKVENLIFTCPNISQIHRKWLLQRICYTNRKEPFSF